MIKDKTIVISAAGTMGHINPGLSFAFLLKKYSPNIKIIFLTQKKNTNQIIRHDYFCYIDSLFTVEATGISRKALLKNLKLIKDSFKILDKIKKLYKDHNVNLVLGMGGYLSGYATYAAKQLKIPYIIHEQNIVMGLANKLSKKKAERVLVSFPKKGKNVVMVGNPRLLLARSVLKDKKLKMKNHILVLSGSLGASFINNLLIDFLKTSESHEYFTTLVTGKRYYDDTVKKLSEIAGEHYRVLPYLDNPLKYMKESNLLISRSGATTIFEAIGLEIPTIFIPSPNVVNNHQLKNAQYLRNMGAAQLLTEKEVTMNTLQNTIKMTINDANLIKKLHTLSNKYSELLKTIEWDEYFEKNN